MFGAKISKASSYQLITCEAAKPTLVVFADDAAQVSRNAYKSEFLLKNNIINNFNKKPTR